MKSRASSARPHIRGRALLRQVFADQPARPLAAPPAPTAIAPISAQPAPTALTTLAWLNGFRVDAPAEPSFTPAGKRSADLSTTVRNAALPLAAPPRAR